MSENNYLLPRARTRSQSAGPSSGEDLISGNLYRPHRPIQGDLLHREPAAPTPSFDIPPIVFSGGLYRTFGANQRPFYERSNLYRSAPSESSSSHFTQRTPSERKRVQRRRRLWLWTGITLLVTLALVAAAVLAALLGRASQQQDTQVIITTTAAPDDITTYQGSIALNKLNFSSDLLNTSSAEFKKLEKELCDQGIGESFSLLSDSEALKNCTVVSFTMSSTGTVVASFSLDLNRGLLQPIVTQEKVSTAENENLDVANLVESVITSATQRSQDSNKPLIRFFQETTTNESTISVTPSTEILCSDFPNLPNQVQSAGIPNTAILWNCSHSSSTNINSRNGICDFSCPLGYTLQGKINGQKSRLKCVEVNAGVGDWVWLVPVYESSLECNIETTTLPPEGSGDVG